MTTKVGPSTVEVRGLDASWHGIPPYVYIRPGFVAVPSSCAMSGSVTMLWATDGDTGSASSARVFILLISALKRLVTSCPTLLGVSAQMDGVSIPVGDTQSHHGHHSLDSVAEMVVTAASAMML